MKRMNTKRIAKQILCYQPRGQNHMSNGEVQEIYETVTSHLA